MNKLHVNGLPAEITSKDLRALFEQFGPVVSTKIIMGLNRKCLGLGIVEMSFAEDVEEILQSKDRISIGGKRPHIWRAFERPTIGEVIRATDRNDGVHVAQCADDWYVFAMKGGWLQWCRLFESEQAARAFASQRAAKSS